MKQSATKKRTIKPSAKKSTTTDKPSTPPPPPENEDASTKAAIDAAIVAASRVLNDVLEDEWKAGAGADVIDKLDELDIKAEEAHEARNQEQMEDSLRQELQRADHKEIQEQARRKAEKARAATTTTIINQPQPTNSEHKGCSTSKGDDESSTNTSATQWKMKDKTLQQEDEKAKQWQKINQNNAHTSIEDNPQWYENNMESQQPPPERDRMITELKGCGRIRDTRHNMLSKGCVRYLNI